MSSKLTFSPPMDVESVVANALEEDVGTGDVTADLVDHKPMAATVVVRESAVLCGGPYFESAFRQLDPHTQFHWHYEEGESMDPDTPVCRVQGDSRALLTAERTALNFLQLLSATATQARSATHLIRNFPMRILDTRKTLPGLRQAQKYAVRCGGCDNHRMGLYDAILIKENHIASLGGVGSAVASARRRHPDLPVEVEVENIAQLAAAIEAGADMVMLDNFDIPMVREAVQHAAGRVKLEVSGGIQPSQLRELSATGVDYVSVGALTKNVTAIDYSLRLAEPDAP